MMQFYCSLIRNLLEGTKNLFEITALALENQKGVWMVIERVDLSSIVCAFKVCIGPSLKTCLILEGGGS